MSTGSNGTDLERSIEGGTPIVLDSNPDPVALDLSPATVFDPVEHVLRRLGYVDEIINQLMKPDTHYGKIPGCQKLSLWQPGAEALAMAFQLRPRFEFQVVDNPFGHEGHREVICTCRIENADGCVLTEAFGSCSTLESKYRWRSGVPCPECGEKLRKSKQKNKPPWYCWAAKGGCGWEGTVQDASEQRRENPDLADEFHTVLSMARKRALVLAVKTVLAASDRFTESDDDHGRGKYDDAPSPDVYDDAPPPAARYVPKAQAWKKIKAAMAGRQVTTDDLKARMVHARLDAEKLTSAEVAALVRWARSQPESDKPEGLVPLDRLQVVADLIMAKQGDLGAIGTMKKIAEGAGVEDFMAWPATEWDALLDGIKPILLPDEFAKIRDGVAP